MRIMKIEQIIKTAFAVGALTLISPLLQAQEHSRHEEMNQEKVDEVKMDHSKMGHENETGTEVPDSPKQIGRASCRERV